MARKDNRAEQAVKEERPPGNCYFQCCPKVTEAKGRAVLVAGFCGTLLHFLRAQVRWKSTCKVEPRIQSSTTSHYYYKYWPWLTIITIWPLLSDREVDCFLKAVFVERDWLPRADFCGKKTSTFWMHHGFVCVKHPEFWCARNQLILHHVSSSSTFREMELYSCLRNWSLMCWSTK